MAFVIAPVGGVAILGGIAGSLLKAQALVSGADKFVFVRVIVKVFRQELAYANELWLAEMVGILVKSVYLRKFPKEYFSR